MQFDVIIGNPPYQLSTEGSGKQAVPIYQKFVEQAKALEPRFLSMVIPARWFSGGMGLDDFRESMLKDNRVRSIDDYLTASDVFPGVGLKGGVCYFLWDRDNPGSCRVSTYYKDEPPSIATRPLLEKGADVFIRFNEGLAILKKVVAVETGNKKSVELPEAKKFMNLVSSIGAFGLDTTFRGKDKKSGDDLKVYRNGGVGYVARSKITKEQSAFDKWKVYVGAAAPGTGNKDTYPHRILSTPFLGEPGSISSWTYNYIGPFDSKSEAESVLSYGRNSFRASTNQVWQFVFAVRDGTVAIYQNKSSGPPYLLRIMPNLAPVWVGRTPRRRDGKPIANYEIISLKVYGPDYKYYQPGESADAMKNGYVGGQGWLVRVPGKTDKPLPRILYYGDSISGGYGDRFTALMKDKAYCYHWSGFVGNVGSFPSAAFEAAAGVAPFDVIIFNNGLHSLSWSPDKVTDAQIEAVARNMVHAFRKGAPKAKLIWAATTPHTAKGKPVTSVGDLNPIVIRINTLAEKVMKEESVDIVDLYALLKDRLNLAAGDQYHWSGDAYQLIAEALQKKCDAVLPRP